MNRRSALTPVTLALALGVVTLLSSCAGTAPKSDGSALPEVSVAKYSNVVATLDYEHGVAALPTTDLDTNAPEFTARILHAIAVRTDACMAKQGLPAIAAQQDWRPYVGDEDRTLGRWSTVYANKYGVAPAPESQPAEIDLASRGTEFTGAYSACQDKAKTSLDAQLQFAQDQNVISAIKWQAFKLATTSTAGKKAIQTWHGCAEAAGVVLDEQSGGPSTQYSSQGKESEIKAFTAYAECARTTAAIQTIFTLRAQYETALLDASEAQVAAFQDERAGVVKQLDDAIAGR
jgi:hypothetical protein